MKYCPTCGHPVGFLIPPGDQPPRAVCGHCGTIHYQNPRVVVGCVPEWQGRILLCRRAIEPRRGYWTTPAGFLEIGESLQARRGARDRGRGLARGRDRLAAVGRQRAARRARCTCIFRARMLDAATSAAGAESLEVGLFDERDIPWDDIAFRSIHFALQRYLADRSHGVSCYISTTFRSRRSADCAGAVTATLALPDTAPLAE